MICETCAPESENVTTVRGCFMSSSAWSWFSLAIGCRKKRSRSFSSARSIIASTGSTPRSRAISRHRAMRALSRVHDEDPLVRRPRAPRRRWDGARRARARPRPDGGAAPDRAAAASARSSGSARSSLPHGQAVEGQLGLEREHDGERAAVHLREHAAAAGRRLLEQGEVRAPEIGLVAPAEQAPGDGPPGLDGQIAQPHVVVAQTRRRSPPARSPASSKMPGVHLAHDADQPAHLVPRGQAARDRAPVGRLVARRARGREADGAGANGVAQLALHGAQVVLAGRLLEGALAHGVRAQRGVADVAGVVDALGQRRRRGRGTPGTSSRSSRCRRPSPRRRCPRRARGCARPDAARSCAQGARVKPQLPITTVVTPCQHEQVPQRIPEDLGVHVRVAVDEAGRHHLAVGVDHLARALADATDGGDAAVAYGRRRLGSGAVRIRRSPCRS